MPKRTKIKPLNLGKESLGERLSKIRKEKGLTQVELAKKIGITQVLISSYEKNRTKPNYEMIIRFSIALKISADEILGLKKQTSIEKPSLKILRRLKAIAALPPTKQKALFQTIDTFLKGARQ